jgi:predicted patatin/cPLA2 family phospholipase
MHPVAQVLRERRATGSRPGARGDGHRVGLAVEGGAMRGVVSAGMLVALEELGYREVFDAVYGSSAGSFNAAYFLTGRAWHGLPLYVDMVADGEVVRWGRLLGRGPVLCLERVLDVLMERRAPLDWQGVLASRIELCVIASSVAEMRPVPLTRFDGPAELRQALQAGATIPFLAGSPVEFRGRLLLDAAVTQAHPYEAAVADRCTHVLSLSTRPRGRLLGRPGLASRIQAWRLDRLRSGLGAANRRRQAGYREAQLRLAALTEQPGDPPHVLDVTPAPGSPEVPRLTRDVGRILQGAQLGYEAAAAAVEHRIVHAALRLTAMTAEDT